LFFCACDFDTVIVINLPCYQV